jgi:hypothetical protein
MLGRSLVCAITILMIATPAAAGERTGYTPIPDTLSLLMQDDDATHGGNGIRLMPVPGFTLDQRVVAGGAEADDLVVFDALNLSSFRYLAVTADGILSATGTWRLPEVASGRVLRPDVNPALSEIRAGSARGHRRRSALSASLEFRLDGREESPPFTLGGGAGTVLNMVRKR